TMVTTPPAGLSARNSRAPIAVTSPAPMCRKEILVHSETAAIKRPLDALNFFLADVRDGLGPYLAIYLLTVQKWDEASIGVVMTIGGVAAIVAQTPAGALIDHTKAKRAVLIAAAVVITLGSLAIPFVPGFIPVAALQAL